MKFNEFRSKWLEVFAKDAPKRDLQKYVLSTYDLLWHVFSYELIPENTYLEGEKARKAFDELSKYEKENTICIALYDDPYKDETFSLPLQNATSEKLEEYIEIYVVAKDFSWTYIKTHEEYIGPYFYRPHKKE